MTILYKICFNIDRDDDSKFDRPYGNNICDIVKACLVSLVKQISSEDNIVFFLDGEDEEDIIETVCTEFNVNYKILSFNHKCAAKINNECILYIINNIEDDNEIIYLCEDDYLHYNNCLQHIKDFLNEYPNYFCHPVDYPNLYTNNDNQASEIILSKNWHWRSVKSSTYTIAFTKTVFDLNYSIFTNINRSLFYDHIINLIYVFTKCFSPIPSLTSHIDQDCLPPCIDTKKLFTHERDGMDRGNMSITDWKELYIKGGYDDVGSGPGSLLENNYELIDWLVEFINEEDINNILDLGCGDMQWIPRVLSETNIEYTGVDCVPDLILNNRKKHKKLHFICQDIVTYYIEKQKYDLIFIKDVLQHFNKDRAREFIDNIRQSGVSHSIIIVPYYIDTDIEKYLIDNNYKLVYKYQSDEPKKVFVFP